jgi:tRNA(fMet)-specific endonuclease VapC
MSFLLDTNICSAQIKGDQRVFNRFVPYGGRLHVSVISVGELVIWASRAGAPPKRHQDVNDLLQLVMPLDMTRDVARRYGEVQAGLLDVGLQAPELDLWIASSALIHNLTLVTHNTAHFANVPGLSYVDRMVP